MDVLTRSFFEKGAFLTDDETGDILLGEGGEVSGSLDLRPGSSVFYLKDFYHDRYLVYRPQRWHRFSRSELLKLLPEEPFTVARTGNSDDLYAEDFTTLKEAFGDDLKKVVLVSREEFRVSDPLAAKITFMRRALTFGVGRPYGLWHGPYGVVGSTPELLYAINGSSLKTFALAGTSALGSEKELLHSPKDRLEHDLVVTDIKEKLSPFCTQISSAETQIFPYGRIIHLKTDIEATLKAGVHFPELISSLSPTAALGGYPQEQGLKFLRETRYFKRHPERYFGSAFGVHAPGLNQCVVSIRNIQWEGNLFYIESGGGVLPASTLEKELAEITLKRETIKAHYL